MEQIKKRGRPKKKPGDPVKHHKKTEMQKAKELHIWNRNVEKARQLISEFRKLTQAEQTLVNKVTKEYMKRSLKEHGRSKDEYHKFVSAIIFQKPSDIYFNPDVIKIKGLKRFIFMKQEEDLYVSHTQGTKDELAEMLCNQMIKWDDTRETILQAVELYKTKQTQP